MTFEELLSQDGSITIHQKNIHALVIEMYKVQNNLAPGFMCNIFPKRNLNIATCVANNTRNHRDFYNHLNPRSTKWGLETLRHLGPIMETLRHLGPIMETLRHLGPIMETLRHLGPIMETLRHLGPIMERYS